MLFLILAAYEGAIDAFDLYVWFNDILRALLLVNLSDFGRELHDIVQRNILSFSYFKSIALKHFFELRVLLTNLTNLSVGQFLNSWRSRLKNKFHFSLIIVEKEVAIVNDATSEETLNHKLCFIKN